MPDNSGPPIVRILLVCIGTVLVCTTCGDSTGKQPLARTPTGSRTLPPTPDAPFLLARDSATLVFLGTVTKRAGVSTSAISASNSTTVVRADSVFVSPGSVGTFAGALVTVVTADTSELALGRQYLFLAYGLIADSSLVVRQTGRYSVAGRVNQIPLIVATADTMLADSARKRHVDSADVAVVGRLTADSAATLPADIARSYAGELDPKWRIGTVAIDTVFKPHMGFVATVLRVAFRGSRHVVYRRMPHPRVGDTAIFVLRRLSSLPSDERPGLDTANTYVIDDSLDVATAREKSRFKLIVVHH